MTVADFAAAMKSVLKELANERVQINPNDAVRDRIARERGIGNPTDPEQLVYCKSPITGSTFTARSIASRDPEIGNRVVELLDYQRPAGWNVHKRYGGMVEDAWDLVDGEDNTVEFDPKRKPGIKFQNWFWATFLQRDANALIGRPLPQGWRVPEAGENVVPEGSITITPEQLTRLGINPEDLRAAIEQPVEKAAE
jgi:hypothetical protein